MAADSSTGRSLLIVLVAFAVVSLAIAAYAFYGRKAPASAGEVLSVRLYPIHRNLATPGSVNGLGGQAEEFDEMLVFANVRIENRSQEPLLLQDMWSTVELPDNVERSTDVSQSDFDKVFVAYPATQVARKAPLRRDVAIPPGQQQEGLMIFHYELSRATWDSRKSMHIVISFQNQNDLLLTVPPEVFSAYSH
ncbi:hypothetical protein [Silvibacterium sp.]|uniref:hypothetical protein n=1 Tax=Silvibacterium sp. TaxID=1964179 RepID=UPI0039E60123